MSRFSYIIYLVLFLFTINLYSQVKYEDKDVNSENFLISKSNDLDGGEYILGSLYLISGDSETLIHKDYSMFNSSSFFYKKDSVLHINSEGIFILNKEGVVGSEYLFAKNEFLYGFDINELNNVGAILLFDSETRLFTLYNFNFKSNKKQKVYEFEYGIEGDEYINYKKIKYIDEQTIAVDFQYAHFFIINPTNQSSNIFELDAALDKHSNAVYDFTQDGVIYLKKSDNKQHQFYSYSFKEKRDYLLTKSFVRESEDNYNQVVLKLFYTGKKNEFVFQTPMSAFYFDGIGFSDYTTPDSLMILTVVEDNLYAMKEFNSLDQKIEILTKKLKREKGVLSSENKDNKEIDDVSSKNIKEPLNYQKKKEESVKDYNSIIWIVLLIIGVLVIVMVFYYRLKSKK